MVTVRPDHLSNPLNMLLGEYQPSIDNKHRLALPKNLRDEVRGNQIIITKGFEDCILGYAKDDWEAEAYKHLETSISDAPSRHLKQYLYSGASEAALDDQGRFVIPGNLTDYAGIENEIVVIGAGDHFEIWDPEKWEEHLEKIEGEVR